MATNQLQQAKAPSLPTASSEYSCGWQDTFNGILRLYFNRLDNFMGQLLGPTGAGFISAPTGHFMITSTQTPAVANTAYPLVFDTSVLANNLSLGTPASRILIQVPGYYLILLSAHWAKSAGNPNIWLWTRTNGVDNANSAINSLLQGGAGADTSLCGSDVTFLNSGDYLELVWAADVTTTTLQQVAATAFAPATPAVNFTITLISA